MQEHRQKNVQKTLTYRPRYSSETPGFVEVDSLKNLKKNVHIRVTVTRIYSPGPIKLQSFSLSTSPSGYAELLPRRDDQQAGEGPNPKRPDHCLPNLGKP